MRVCSNLEGMKKGTCLEIFSKPSDQSVLIPTSLDVGNNNKSKNVAPDLSGGLNKDASPKTLPFPFLPRSVRSGEGRGIRALK